MPIGFHLDVIPLGCQGDSVLADGGSWSPVQSLGTFLLFGSHYHVTIRGKGCQRLDSVSALLEGALAGQFLSTRVVEEVAGCVSLQLDFFGALWLEVQQQVEVVVAVELHLVAEQVHPFLDDGFAQGAASLERV